jgi:protein TonB
MKKLLCISAISMILASYNLYGQTITSNKFICNGELIKTIDKQKVEYFVDQTPQFPEGETALMSFIKGEFKYPKEQTKWSRKFIIVSFVIDTSGAIRYPCIKNPVSNTKLEPIDVEALRVVSKMPSWKPGIKDGKVVPVLYNVPIQLRQVPK